MQIAIADLFKVSKYYCFTVCFVVWFYHFYVGGPIFFGLLFTVSVNSYLFDIFWHKQAFS